MVKYACTYAQKEVSEDSYEEGRGNSRTCVLAERANLTADTLVGLLDAIRKKYFIELDYVLVGDSCDWITYSRTENDDGDEPSARELEAWKLKQQTLWCADYTFSIEKRDVAPVSLEELKAFVRVEQ